MSATAALRLGYNIAIPKPVTAAEKPHQTEPLPSGSSATPAPHTHIPQTLRRWRPTLSENLPVRSWAPPQVKPYTPTTQPMRGKPALLVQVDRPEYPDQSVNKFFY